MKLAVRALSWAILVAFVLPQVVTAQGREVSDLEMLQGTWVCVESLKDGQPVQDYVGVKAQITGDDLTWFFPRADGTYVERKNKYRIDPAQNPKHFDWWPVDNPNSVDLRIYAVDQESLRWGTNLDNKTRPASFEAARWQFTGKRVRQTTVGEKPAAIDGWGEVVDPDGDCTVRTSGNKVTITVPGTRHDLWFDSPVEANRFNAPRVWQPVEGDFVAKVKVTADHNLAPNGGYNGAGLVVWESPKQYLRLERNKFTRLTEPHGPFSYTTPLYDRNDRRINQPQTQTGFFPARSTWLRIERAGDTITTAVSHDGTMWTETGRLATEFPRTVMVGVHMTNSNPREFVAEFEDFKLLKE